MSSTNYEANDHVTVWDNLTDGEKVALFDIWDHAGKGGSPDEFFNLVGVSHNEHDLSTLLYLSGIRQNSRTIVERLKSNVTKELLELAKMFDLDEKRAQLGPDGERALRVRAVWDRFTGRPNNGDVRVWGGHRYALCCGIWWTNTGDTPSSRHRIAEPGLVCGRCGHAIVELMPPKLVEDIEGFWISPWDAGKDGEVTVACGATKEVFFKPPELFCASHLALLTDPRLVGSIRVSVFDVPREIPIATDVPGFAFYARTDVPNGKPIERGGSLGSVQVIHPCNRLRVRIENRSYANAKVSLALFGQYPLREQEQLFQECLKEEALKAVASSDVATYEYKIDG